MFRNTLSWRCNGAQRSCPLSGRWMKPSQTKYWNSRCFRKALRRKAQNACRTMTTSERNCYGMVSTKNYSGQNTSRSVNEMETTHWCILSSAITFSRTSKSAVRRCTSQGNLDSRSRLIGPEIRPKLSIRILEKSPVPGYLWVSWPIANTHL